MPFYEMAIIIVIIVKHCGLYNKVVLTFEFVGEILKCDHSNKSY